MWIRFCSSDYFGDPSAHSFIIIRWRSSLQECKKSRHLLFFLLANPCRIGPPFWSLFALSFIASALLCRTLSIGSNAVDLINVLRPRLAHAFLVFLQRLFAFTLRTEIEHLLRVALHLMSSVWIRHSVAPVFVIIRDGGLYSRRSPGTATHLFTIVASFISKY